VEYNAVGAPLSPWSGPSGGHPPIRQLSAESTGMSRFLIVLGLVIVAIGLLWPLLTRLGLGRLPGDIVIQRENFSFYFPLATCIVVSVLLSVVFWLFNR
jgi:DUF2905 family protein